MLVDRLPPQDLDTEASCLASILLSKEALLRVTEILQPEDFYLDKHATIYSAILDLEKKDLPVDLTTLKQRLTDLGKFETIGGDASLAELYQTVSTSANAEFYAKRISELSLRRRLIEVSTDSIEKCYDMAIETDELADIVETEIFNVTEKRVSSEFKSIEAIAEDTRLQIEHWYDTKKTVTGMSSGFTKLDEILTGFHGSELIIVASRPSMGKTSFALNIMNNIALKEKKAALFFSLEMPAVQLFTRLLCIETMIDSQLVRTGMVGDEEMHQLWQTIERYKKTNIFIDDTPSLTILQMRAKARRLAQRIKDLGIIIVDYIQYIPSTSRMDRHLQVAEISRFLKQLARDLDVPVIALSQLSRAVEQRHDQVPTLADLRESGSLEQDADVVLFLYREEKVKKDTERKGIADIIVAKQRNGPLGIVPLKFWGRYTKFENLDTTHSYEEMRPHYEDYE